MDIRTFVHVVVFPVCLLSSASALAARASEEKPASLLQAAVSQPVPDDRTLGGAEQARWIATLDRHVFGSTRTPDGQPVANSDEPAVGSHFVVDLPDTGRVELVVQSITEVVEGVTSISGSLVSDPESMFRLSFEGDAVLGSIEVGEHVWIVEPQGDGRHLLRKLSHLPIIPDSEPEEGQTYARKSQARTATIQSPVVPMTGGGGRVDVLFLYASDVDNPSLRASDIVTRVNSVLSNSLVSSNDYIVSAGVQAIGTDFGTQNRATIMNKMIARTSPFVDLVPDWMFSANADVAFLIINENSSSVDFPPYGRVAGVAINKTPEKPYVLSTKTYAIGDNTAVHELGHVFGGKHEDDTGSDSNHPVIGPSCAWMTVMGGYITCTFTGLPATTVRLNYFSNPALSYGGLPLGVAGSKNMKGYLETTMPQVSSWRNNGDPSAPGTPTSITSDDLMCNGANLITWSGSSTGIPATTYRLYRSTTSSFTSPTVVYTGNKNFKQVTVPSGATHYFRVRACNSLGCSNYTTQVSGTYFSGCL